MGDARQQDPDRTPPRDDASAEAASPSWIPPRRSPEETMRILKALTNPLRMRILRVLSLGETMRVSDIARAVDAPANSVSYHLRQLERADIAHRAAPEEGQDARETWWQVPEWDGLVLDPEAMRGIPGGTEAARALSSSLSEDAAQLFSAYPPQLDGWPGLQSDAPLRLTREEARELIDRIGELINQAATTSRVNAGAHREDTQRYDLRLVLRASVPRERAGEDAQQGRDRSDEDA